MRYVAFKANCIYCKHYVGKKCRRYPKELAKAESDFCGEFATNLVKKPGGTPVFPWDKKYKDL